MPNIIQVGTGSARTTPTRSTISGVGLYRSEQVVQGQHITMTQIHASEDMYHECVKSLAPAPSVL